MTRTQQTSQASNRVKKARRSSAQDSRRQPTGFITWTDWRAFQPTRPSSSNKSSDDESPKYSHTDGWHPDAFADRYRRSSYPKLSPLPVKNLNILNSQRITTWERDFFSSLLVPDQGPGQHIKSEPEISQEQITTVCMEALENFIPSLADLTDATTEDSPDNGSHPDTDMDMDMTIMSSIDFDFEKCLAEVEQIVCDSIKDIPSIFDNQEKVEPKPLEPATTTA